MADITCQNLAQIKEKIAKKEMDILSQDLHRRENAALRVAKQFLLFETQLLMLDFNGPR